MAREYSAFQEKRGDKEREGDNERGGNKEKEDEVNNQNQEE